MDAGCPVHENCIGSTCAGDGLGQSYSLCQPLGTPGNDATYTQAMAQAAGNAAPQPAAGDTCQGDPGNQCSGLASCSGKGTDAYFVDLQNEGGLCTVWAIASSGSGTTAVVSGHVYTSASCGCPEAADPTWN